MSTLAQYEAMRTALMQCASVDEAKEIRDKAAAIAAYARLRDDAQIEVWSQEIKLRASIRIGELVQDMERSLILGRGLHELPPSGKFKRQAIEEAGLTQGQAYRMEKLAGPKDANLRAAGQAAAERYFAQARVDQVPGTENGLKAAVATAVEAAMGPDGIRRAAKGLHAERQAEKRMRREAKIVTLTRATRAASVRLGSRLYNVIYADPPWRYEPYSVETGMDRSADNHYPTMTTDDIAALPIPAAPCCGLFLWATAPMIFEAGDVLRAWGFAYSTQIIWNKNRIGLGYRVRNKHEILLIGTRGGFPLPSPDRVRASVIDAPLGRHSEKPADFAEMIESQYPDLAKVELFARQPRPGWDVWGNEAASADEMEAAYA